MILPNQLKSIPGPVVIGGIGGSGTRVIAQIFHELHYFIGNDLNGPLDNLTYTLLFKRKRWYYHHKNNKKLIANGLSILQKRMLRSGNLSPREYWYLVSAVLSMARYGHNHVKDGAGLWPLDRVKRMFEPIAGLSENYSGWGWKEPNSHLLISEMNDFFSHFKYIHLIRHGLDMAYNQNQQQLFNWGPMFGVDLPKEPHEIPQASFSYWVRANRLALEKGALLGAERFLWINYDQFCKDPEPGLRKLVAFLNLEVAEEVFQKCLALPKVAESTGKYKSKPMQDFQDEDLAFLHSLGFDS